MQPERARGWIATLLPLAEQGGPVVSLVLLVLGGLSIYWLVGLNNRTHDSANRLFQALQESHKQTVELALRCHQSGGRPHREGRIPVPMRHQP